MQTPVAPRAAPAPADSQQVNSGPLLQVPVSGQVLSLHLCASAAEPMRTVAEMRAVAGLGVEGDRYAYKIGTYSKKEGADRQFTLIEAEALDALAREYGLTLRPEDARRNAVTCGASLNHLVGRTFRLGEATLRGIRLCDPCGHLERLTGKTVFAGLVHRGGLRCEILSGGVIRAGDGLRSA
jgi:MOSC domain-containing protein YiiM